MKKILLILMLSGVAFFSQAQSFFTDLSYDDFYSQNVNHPNSQPYFVYFSADWCFPCQMMEETVFQDKLVIDYTMTNYEAIKLNDDSFDAMLLAAEYEVKTLPTILIFDEKGTLVKRLTGLQTGSNFLSVLKEYNL